MRVNLPRGAGTASTGRKGEGGKKALAALSLFDQVGVRLLERLGCLTWDKGREPEKSGKSFAIVGPQQEITPSGKKNENDGGKSVKRKGEGTQRSGGGGSAWSDGRMGR